MKCISLNCVLPSDRTFDILKIGVLNVCEKEGFSCFLYLIQIFDTLQSDTFAENKTIWNNLKLKYTMIPHVWRSRLGKPQQNVNKNKAKIAWLAIFDQLKWLKRHEKLKGIEYKRYLLQKISPVVSMMIKRMNGTAPIS